MLNLCGLVWGPLCCDRDGLVLEMVSPMSAEFLCIILNFPNSSCLKPLSTPNIQIKPGQQCVDPSASCPSLSNTDLTCATHCAKTNMQGRTMSLTEFTFIIVYHTTQGRTMRYAGVALRLTGSEVEEGMAAHGSCPDELQRFLRMEC